MGRASNIDCPTIEPIHRTTLSNSFNNFPLARLHAPVFRSRFVITFSGSEYIIRSDGEWKIINVKRKWALDVSTKYEKLWVVRDLGRY